MYIKTWAWLHTASKVLWACTFLDFSIYLFSIIKDSHTLYLEQELESLKVVLDIKNKQIHEHDKKLMQIDKLVRSLNWLHEAFWGVFLKGKHKSFLYIELIYSQMDKNVKLDECLKKVQQENEDLKARMDKHAALSRYKTSCLLSLALKRCLRPQKWSFLIHLSSLFHLGVFPRRDFPLCSKAGLRSWCRTFWAPELPAVFDTSITFWFLFVL